MSNKSIFDKFPKSIIIEGNELSFWGGYIIEMGKWLFCYHRFCNYPYQYYPKGETNYAQCPSDMYCDMPEECLDKLYEHLLKDGYVE